MFEEFDCKDCDDHDKMERGCSQDAPFPYWTDIHGDERLRCPRLTIYHDPLWWNDIISAYNGFKAGYLPHAGGLMDQHCTFSEQMSIIDWAINKTDEVKNERRRQQDNLKDRNARRY